MKVWIFGNLVQPVLKIFYDLPPGFESLSQSRVRKVVFTIWQFFFRFSEENENELLCMISVVNFLKSRNFCCWFSSIFLTCPVFPSRDKTLRKYVLWFKNNATNVAGFNTFKHNFNLNFTHRTWNVRAIVLSENQFIVRKLTTFPASSKT